MFVRQTVDENSELHPTDFWEAYGLNMEGKHELTVVIALPVNAVTDGAGPVERINSAIKFVKSKRRVRPQDQRAMKLSRYFVNARALSLKRAAKMKATHTFPRVDLSTVVEGSADESSSPASESDDEESSASDDVPMRGDDKVEAEEEPEELSRGESESDDY